MIGVVAEHQIIFPKNYATLAASLLSIFFARTTFNQLGPAVVANHMLHNQLYQTTCQHFFFSIVVYIPGTLQRWTICFS